MQAVTGEEERVVLAEKSRKQTVWSMSRVISNILGGGRGSLPPDLDKETEKISFKTVFKKRSV